ncbi:MAG: hypothetical protein J7521_20120 [Caulobacter sp.]|nr:hypothetical protein [Caulobacter sp.]
MTQDTTTLSEREALDAEIFAILKATYPGRSADNAQALSCIRNLIARRAPASAALVEALRKLAGDLEAEAFNDRAEAKAGGASSVGSASALAGNLFSAVANESAARRILAALQASGSTLGVTEERNSLTTAGLIMAATIVMHGHGEDTIAGEILTAAGVSTEADIRAAGLDDYDIDILRPVLAALALTSEEGA